MGGIFANIIGLEGWLGGILQDVCNAMLTAFMDFIKLISPALATSKPFTDMLGSSGGGTSTVYGLAVWIHNIGVVPIAHAILALVMLVQVIKISQKIDAQATMPAVKEVLFLAVFFVIFSYLINNSVQLCAAIFGEVQKLSDLLIGRAGGGRNFGQVTVADGLNIGTYMMVMFFCIIAWIVSLIAYIVALVVSYARALQLYIYMAFAPIPLALLGLDETRSSGVNFIKNFIALCLAGTILIFILMCFPLIVSGVTTHMFNASSAITIATGGVTELLPFLELLAVCILLVYGVAKSGSWAKEIMGG